MSESPPPPTSSPNVDPASPANSADAPVAGTVPLLWGDPAPNHFDLRLPWWAKTLLVIAAVVVAMLFLDQRVAVWASEHRIPDLANAKAPGGDPGRELMWLEQWGQGVCSVVVILAVALLDPAGRRRALSIALACVVTVILTHLLKDVCGRSRPFVVKELAGGWIWGGPGMGFKKGASWGSFPSAHTTGAFALASGLAWFYPRGRGLFMTLATITAVQRVLHTAHYVSDTIAGMGLAVLLTRTVLASRLAGTLINAAPPGVRAWWLTDAKE